MDFEDEQPSTTLSKSFGGERGDVVFVPICSGSRPHSSFRMVLTLTVAGA